MDTGEGKWNKQNSAPYWCRAVRKLHTRSLSIWHQMCTSLLGRKPQPCKHTTIKSMQVIFPENSPQLCLAVTPHSPFPGLGLFIFYIRTIKSRRDKVTNKTGTSMSLLNKTHRHFQMSTIKLLSHDLLLPLVGRELSDQISVTAK